MQNTRRIAAALIGLLLSVSVQAQVQTLVLNPNAGQFAEGAVMLTSGAVVKGEISLDWMSNKLDLRANDTIYTLPAQAVRVFAIRGETAPQKKEQYVALTRIFHSYSYPWSTKQAPELKMWAFFEQLSEGPVILLRRKQPISYTYVVASNNNQRLRRYSNSEIQTTFYLTTDEGKLVTLRKTKRDLLAYFSKQAPEIKAYAKDNDLSFKNARELAFLVNYANSLQAPQLQQEPALPTE
ncbi:hypothetical protein [Hymenobacter crusticola]|uniref:DUF4468 domain-containing protein n=1 Tax=Hymenobacter crusticola TaxID=1770526 RepID=A0A243WF63_9BACT|nr:hypothetical protein [Hymenobacter crusticola]OUJ74292.1 hypothetical protein BXP70_11275 [Hymenobacter crusticola]